MVTQGNIIYGFTVASVCMFETNYDKTITLTSETLDMIYRSIYALTISAKFQDFFMNSCFRHQKQECFFNNLN